MFGGLPGGSPGPNVQATLKILLIVLAVSLIVGGFLFWLILEAAKIAGITS